MLRTLLIRGCFGLVAALGLFAIAPSGTGSAFDGAALAKDSAKQGKVTWSSEPMITGRSRFLFKGWKGPALPVWAYVPEKVERKTAPILFVLHGAKRDPRRYLEQWVEGADKHGFIIVAPEFSKEDFRGSRRYNLGHLFKKNGAPIRDEALWSYSAIEPLFDTIVAQLGSGQKQYTLYGHSAGSQFIHRFMFLKPDARVKRFLPANAGWYTFPDMELDYPFGLAGVPVSEGKLKAVLAKDVVLLLGDKDNDTNHKSLNRSDGAMKQGPHRFARGQNFYFAAAALAQEKGWEFNWRMRIIPGVAHSNGGIARGAADLVK